MQFVDFHKCLDCMHSNPIIAFLELHCTYSIGWPRYAGNFSDETQSHIANVREPKCKLENERERENQQSKVQSLFSWTHSHFGTNVFLQQPKALSRRAPHVFCVFCCFVVVVVGD